MSKVRWGILSTAKIGVEKVIPAMQQTASCEIVAIASRDGAKAQAAATRLGIPHAYGSYEELLADPNIEAIYNPLPNHLHVSLSIQALAAGKHVLCEKPIGLSAADARELVAAAQAHPQLKVMEAFMYRFHPQWQLAKRLCSDPSFGALRTIQSFFSYYNDDADNIRNRQEWGGGGLMDIGCYPISLSRFLFGSEPHRVAAVIEYDERYGVDRLASGVLDFGAGTSAFTCSTQLVPYQRVNLFGTQERVEIEIPFNAPPDVPCRLWHQQAEQITEIAVEVCDQYGIQGELFSRAIRNDEPVPTPLADAVGNMLVIEALVRAGASGQWEPVESVVP